MYVIATPRHSGTSGGFSRSRANRRTHHTIYRAIGCFTQLPIDVVVEFEVVVIMSTIIVILIVVLRQQFDFRFTAG